jgi:glycosyltransferase involved in cell wall biosynthesis
MKIGYDAKRIFHNSSGLGNYGRDLVRILASFYPQNQYHLYNPKKGKINRLKALSNIQEHRPKGVWRYLHALWRQSPITRQLKQDKIDLYHGLSGELPKGLNIPSVVTVHDLIFYRYPELYNTIDVFIHKRKIRHAVKKATQVVAISEQTKADLIDYIGISASKIKVIYQGCHPIFKTKLTKNELKKITEKYSLPEKYVLFVGTLEERKNALFIAEALEKTSRNLVFVGKIKSSGRKIKSFVKSKGIEHRVLFIQNISIEDLAAVYQNATVFCYPSFFEGFGIPIIEALYSGIPVITSKEGCFPEAGGPSSIYVNPKDENSLREAVEIIYSESDKCRKKRVSEGLVFAQKFNDEVLAKQWDILYKSLVW